MTTWSMEMCGGRNWAWGGGEGGGGGGGGGEEAASVGELRGASWEGGEVGWMAMVGEMVCRVWGPMIKVPRYLGRGREGH